MFCNAHPLSFILLTVYNPPPPPLLQNTVLPHRMIAHCIVYPPMALKRALYYHGISLEYQQITVVDNILNTHPV